MYSGSSKVRRIAWMILAALLGWLRAPTSVQAAPPLSQLEPPEALTTRPALACALQPCLDFVYGWDADYYGTVAAFASPDSRFVPGDTNQAFDLFFWRDGMIGRASTTAQGLEANDHSDCPVLSGDGRYLYFRSSATNLAPGTVPNGYNFYLKELDTGRLALVSYTLAGVPVNADTLHKLYPAAATFDGRYLLFSSAFGDHVPGVVDLNASIDIFLLDVDPDANGDYFDTRPVTHALSTAPDGKATGNSESSDPHMSEDGRYVVFVTYASDIHPATQSNGYAPDVLLLELGQTSDGTLDPARRTATAINTSCGPSSPLTAQGAYRARVGPWGDTVAFMTASNICNTGDANAETRDPTTQAAGTDIYLSLRAGNDLADRQVIWTSKANGVGAPQTSENITYPGEIEALALAVDPFAPVPVGGVKVAWISPHTNIEPGDDNGVRDLFVRRDSAVYPAGLPVPNWRGPDEPSTEPVDRGGLSADGRYAFWLTFQRYDTAPDEGARYHLYRRRIEPLHTYTLTVEAAGGSVTRLPPGVPLGGAFAYSDTAQVTLTATTDIGYSFAGWSGVDSAAGDQARVALHHPRQVVAQFQAMNAPSAAPLAITTAEDGESAGAQPAITDADPDDTHTLRMVESAAHGRAEIRQNRIHYRPAPNYVGTDRFTIQVTDRYGLELAQPLAVQVSVTPVNDPPTAAWAVGRGPNSGQPIALTIEVNDPDAGDTFTWALVMPPANGTVLPPGRTAAAAGTIYYRPDPGFSGEDGFSFRLSDAAGAGVIAQATVTVTAPLHLPALRHGTP